MFCQPCGIQVSIEHKVCPQCGNPLTGKAVSNKPKVGYASFWRRLVAYLIDYTLILIGSITAFIPIVFLFDTESGSFDLLSTIASIMIWWLYFALMESGERQSTYGKRWMGMKVIDESGQRISFGRATGRHFGKILSGITLLIGYLMALWTERRQALHDKMAGTYVLHTGGQ